MLQKRCYVHILMEFAGSDMWQQRGRVTPTWDTYSASSSQPYRTCLHFLSTWTQLLTKPKLTSVTKHFLQLLVNRGSLAQIKNITAPLCFLHVSHLAVNCSQTLLVPPSVNATLTTELQDDNQNIRVDVHTNKTTYTPREVPIRCSVFQCAHSNGADTAQSGTDQAGNISVAYQ